MKRILCLLTTLALLLACAPLACAEDGGTMTILMYMCGTDLQSDCIGDMYEMCSANTPDWMNIVVQAGGANTWDDNRLTPNNVNRFQISGGDFYNIETIGHKNMGDAETLVDFLDYGLNNFPADRTMLVLWDHGGGATGGVCYDQTANDDCLTIDEITYALYQNSQKHANHMFDIIGFDACLMATYEAAAQLCGSALYMVASEELEPGIGWAYDGWMSAVGQDQSISTEDWAKAIVDAYYAACMAYNPNDYISQSVIYLPGMLQLIQSTELFSQYLVQALEAGEMRTVSRGRQQMYSFGKFADSSSDMVDMMALVNAYRSFAPNAATRVEQALGRAVVHSVGSDMYDSLCGLSILLPQETCDSFSQYIEAYDFNQVFPNYTDFVKGYVKLLQGGSYSFSVQAPEKLDTADMQAPAFTGSLSSAVFVPSGSFVADESGDAAEEAEEAAELEQTEEATEEPAEAEEEYEETEEPAEAEEEYEETEEPAEAEEEYEEEPADSEEETAQPAQGGGSFFSTADSYAPTVSAEGAATETGVLPNGLPASYDPNSAYAYSLTLSQDDLQNLSYVEGMLLMDVSDEEGTYYVDLGYTQNAWVDWDTAQVYSLFDGRWPMMGDQLVAIYDQVKTAAMRRSIIPVTCNGAEGYLVAVFNAEHPEGQIAGFSVGYDENGLPARGVTQLKEGDEIVPRYTMLYYDENDEVQEASFLGDPITVSAEGIPFGYESLEGGEAIYQYCFCLNDVFGGEQYSDFVAFEL